MPDIKWLIDSGAGLPEIINFLLTVALAAAFMIKAKLDQREKDVMWEKLTKLNDRYHRLDALQFGTAKAIQAANGKLNLVNESADGDGNYSLDRE